MITGLVLAGGRGRRVGGADKGLLLYQGQPMAKYSLDALSPWCSRLFINCNRNAEQYAALGATTVTDRVTDFPGPLVALADLLPCLPGARFLILPCDTPGVRAAHVAQLLQASERHPGAWVYLRAEGRDHPLHACVPRTLLSSLRHQVQERGETRMMALLGQLPSVALPVTDAHAFNCNT